MRVKNKIKTIIILGLLTIGCSSKIISSETWIDYDDVSKISVGASQNKVVSSLGEPILITADNDDDLNIIYLYYNYHVTKYLPNKTNEDAKDVRTANFERKTLLKFTFEEDELIGWEEDKLTMSSAMQGGGKSTSMLSYISLLLNLILIITVL